MRDYLVTFYKIVLDGAGHDRCVLQRRARVRARSDVSAAWEAKAIFCRALGIPDWRLLADTCEVVALAQSTA